MCDIPSRIRRDILLRLPAESVFRLRSISKDWRTIIDDPSFIKAHTQNQQASSNTTLLITNSTGPPFYPLHLVDLQALDFTNSGPQTIPATPLKLSRAALSTLPPLPTASCNGLLLISPMSRNRSPFARETNFDEGIWEMWNLLTHERLKLPRPNIKGEVSGYGFGYDFVSDDYKVVLTDHTCVWNKGQYITTRKTQVYSLRSNSWSMIEDCPFDFITNEGAFLNGALHFLLDRLTIIAFDLATERFRTLKLKLPAVVGETRTSDVETRTSNVQLATLGGCLFLSFHILIYGEEECYEGWVMNCYGEEGSWVKLFSIRKDSDLSDLRPVAYVKDNKWVLLQYDKGFLWVDGDGNSVKRVGIHGFGSDFSAQVFVRSDFSAQVFVGSLFRLRESCGSVGDKRKTRKRIADTRLTFCVKDYVKVDRYSYEYPDHEACCSSDENC